MGRGDRQGHGRPAGELAVEALTKGGAAVGCRLKLWLGGLDIASWSRSREKDGRPAGIGPADGDMGGRRGRGCRR
jgi:hypothetical protein